MCSMAFASDALINGRAFRILTVVDDVTREWVELEGPHFCYNCIARRSRMLLIEPIAEPDELYFRTTRYRDTCSVYRLNTNR